MNVKSLFPLVLFALTLLWGEAFANDLSVGVACQGTAFGDGRNNEKLYECAASVAGGTPPYTFTWHSQDFNAQFSNFAWLSRYCTGDTPVSVGVTVTDSLGNDVFETGGTILACEEIDFGCPPLDFPDCEDF